MAYDVQKISGNINGTAPLAAARLSNFATGNTELLPAHKSWIATEVREALLVSPHAWIDIHGYSSHRGSKAGFDNLGLSRNRCHSVKSTIAQNFSKASFNIEVGYGDSASLGGEDNNDGYWRAVEVYVFGSKPYKKEIPPHDPVVLYESPEWFVTNLSLTGGALATPVGGGGFYEGSITFQNGSGTKYEGPIAVTGVSFGLSLGIPGLKADKLFQKAIKFLLDNGGFSHADLPSGAIGIVYKNDQKIKNLKPQHFSGSCTMYFITGSPVLATYGVYLLLFGLPKVVGPTADIPLNLAIPPFALAMQANGYAIISAGGIGIAGSLGASANGFSGGIA
ncbi:OmpA family protein [Dyadobacter aurulentus]|uniref:OmpA family protein n=1 Tax=Dyadobacter sp. UC 10 TaxID=2605428 RepID=UPI0011F349CA|nr:OmpA family protein [Dyadobacter sp. UC 10]KAA0990290.1 OmpA family protein [Dyadobacter sp. UC 10]